MLNYKQSMKFVLKFLRNFRSSWGNLVVFTIPLLLTFPPVLDFFKKHPWLFVILILLFIASWGQVTLYSASISKLQLEYDILSNERDTLSGNMEAMPERVVKSLFQYFNFGYNERITVYRFNDTLFLPVGRYALNEEYKKNGRREYSKTEGFIGKAWVNGIYIKEDLPDPETNYQEYLKEVSSESKINMGKLKTLRMKSRSYFCKNLLTSDNDPIAVIVIESTQEKLPNRDHIEDILQSSIGQLLTDTVKSNLPLGRG